jgi:hypothetical protein
LSFEDEVDITSKFALAQDNLVLGKYEQFRRADAVHQIVIWYLLGVLEHGLFAESLEDAWEVPARWQLWLNVGRIDSAVPVDAETLFE